MLLYGQRIIFDGSMENKYEFTKSELTKINEADGILRDGDVSLAVYVLKRSLDRNKFEKVMSELILCKIKEGKHFLGTASKLVHASGFLPDGIGYLKPEIIKGVTYLLGKTDSKYGDKPDHIRYRHFRDALSSISAFNLEKGQFAKEVICYADESLLVNGGHLREPLAILKNYVNYLTPEDASVLKQKTLKILFEGLDTHPSSSTDLIDLVIPAIKVPLIFNLTQQEANQLQMRLNSSMVNVFLERWEKYEPFLTEAPSINREMLRGLSNMLSLYEQKRG